MKPFRRNRPVTDAENLTAEKVQHILDELNLQKRRALFVREFAIDYDPRAAAERAGFKDGSYGYKLLKSPDILAAITKLQQINASYGDISPEALAGQMYIWANGSVADLYTDNWELKPKSELTKEQLSCIAEVHKKYDKDGRAEVKVKLVDKKGANENLARPMGLYKAPDKEDDDFSNKTESEIEQWLIENDPSYTKET